MCIKMHLCIPMYNMCNKIHVSIDFCVTYYVFADNVIIFDTMKADC